jgi:selenocysteine lyase/cysteine desulfurase
VRVNAERFPAVIAAAASGRMLADNAAGAQLPDVAIDRMHHYLRYDNAQKGAIFARPVATSALVAEAKAEFAALANVPTANVGIGLNATSIAMSFSRLLASTIQRGARIVVTAADHEANVAPWVWLRRFGAQVDVVPVDARGDLDEGKFRAFLDRAPVVVALPWASNATGTVFDVARYAQLAKEARATVIVDGVQALPHFPLQIDPAIDFAFFSAYKMFAPHLAFWYASDFALERYVRADDAHVPGDDARYWTLECGTQSHEALAGFLGTIAYLRDAGGGFARAAIASFARYEDELTRYALAQFAYRTADVVLYGRAPEAARLPVFSLNVRGVATDDLARSFEEANIEARAGDFYAPRLLQSLAADERGRAVRLSFAHYNTPADIDRCFEVIDRVRESRAAESAHA